MKTDELIAALSADASAPSPHRFLRLRLLPALAIVLAVVAVLIGLGVRTDMPVAVDTWRFLLKFALAASLAALALWQALGLYRPERRVRPAILLPVLAILAAAVVLELVLLPSERWLPQLVGNTAAICMVAIPLLSLLPLAALLYGLRAGAPRSPAKAGTMAGIAAAALATTAYALHCPEDSPLFVATWYVLAGAIVTGAGALLGRRLLRW